MNDVLNHPITQHLANLKFYSNFKKNEKAKSFDQFLEFMESGAPKEFQWDKPKENSDIVEFKFDDPFLGDNVDSKTEDAVEKFLVKQRQEENLPVVDIDSWYYYVKLHILNLLKKYNLKFHRKKNPFEILKEILNEFQLLKNFISISDKDFYIYGTQMQHRNPEDFFLIFSGKNKKIENYPLVDCYPRIFVDCKAYSFFIELEKRNLNQADYNFIFCEMQNRLIHCSAKEFELFVNDRTSRPIEIYAQVKGNNPKFRKEYEEIYESIY